MPSCKAISLSRFLSTLSLRRATVAKRNILGNVFNFYPRSPCGERQASDISTRREANISIHALLAESDLNQIHPRRFHYHFYPRSPCGERPRLPGGQSLPSPISIHALLAESDKTLQPALAWHPIFLSTLSLRRATRQVLTISILVQISIHALLAESDNGCVRYCIHARAISIHALLAESDTVVSKHDVEVSGFLSTLSLRRATSDRVPLAELTAISIHALLAESDQDTPKTVYRRTVSFLSTLSLRRATAKVHKTVGHFCAYETNFMGIASSC